MGLAVVAFASDTASADTSSAVITDNSGADVVAGTLRSERGERASSEAVHCTYRALSLSPDAKVYDLDGNPLVVDGTGQWYEKWCGTDFHGAVYVSRVDPLDLLAEARSRLNLPLPQPQLSPAGEQLVNLRTWLWIRPEDWRPLAASAGVPGITVTVVASPHTAVWSMGDGTLLECGPGTVYNASVSASEQSTDCSHTYERSSAAQPGHTYSVSVTVRWRLSWTVDGGTGGGDLGTIARTTSLRVPVAEVQAVNVDSRGGS